MYTSIKPPYEYQVGGSLPANSPTYVRRKADDELYDGLVKGEFCYVLNSRQMGKSSLRVRTMRRLQAEGVACAVIDITSMGTQQVSPEQWYASLVGNLVNSFQISLNLKSWWRDRDFLTPIQRLSEFFEQVLLPATGKNIVIFIDEIDSVLSLPFSSDDFFAFIRSCYNKRAEKPEYQRLTFNLLGVATPSDLIQDKNRTPFNIGRAIALSGLSFEEAQPLLSGLADKGYEPTDLLCAILDWTNGQPFLTQKLCRLVSETPSDHNLRSATAWINEIVQTQVIDHWEIADEPEHFKTIRARLLRSEQRAARLLGIYQQVLLQKTLPADGSLDQVELRLCGLVVETGGQQEQDSSVLKIYNPIYAAVFNLAWIEKNLSDLRPYWEMLNAWISSGCQDESRLLRGQALQDALAWSDDKSLSDIDYHFLSASQTADTKQIQMSLETEREAKQLLAIAQEKAKLTIRKSLFGLGVVSLLAVVVGGVSAVLAQQLEMRRQEVTAKEIGILSKSSEVEFNSDRKYAAAIAAIKAGKQLQKNSSLPNRSELQAQVASALYQSLAFTPEINSFEGHQNIVYDAAFSPDGQIVASASKDANVKLWRPDGSLLVELKGHDIKYPDLEFSNFRLRKFLVDLTGHQDAVYSVSFSPDSQFIATASKDKTVKLWKVDGTLLKTLQGHGSSVIKVQFSQDGQNLISVDRDRSVRVWDLNGNLIKAVTAQADQLACVASEPEKSNEDEIYQVAISPDGQKLASACRNNLVKVWPLFGGEAITFKGHQDEVYDVQFSPDGKWLASVSFDRTVKLWNLEGELVRTLNGHSDRVIGVSFSPDSKTIASTSYDRTIRLWHLDGKLITTLNGHTSRVHAANFSADGQFMVSGSSDKTMKLWQPFNSLAIPLVGHSDSLQGITFAPDGKTLATASSDKTIKLWNLQGQELRSWLAHKAAVIGIQFSPDGQILASSSHDNTVRLWQAQDGKLLHTLKEHKDQVLGLSFSTDNQTIASGSNDHTVKLWGKDGTLLGSLPHNSTVVRVNLSPDRKWLASGGGENRVKLWRLSDRTVKDFPVSHESWVGGVNFSPDSKTIVSASDDKLVKLWDLEGNLLNNFYGHMETVFYAAFSPDNQLIASASADNTIKLWRRDGTLVITLKGHTSGIFNLAFSPDSNLLASASFDKSGIIWNLSDLRQQDVLLERLLAKACDRTKNYLTHNNSVVESDRHLCD